MCVSVWMQCLMFPTFCLHQKAQKCALHIKLLQSFRHLWFLKAIVSVKWKKPGYKDILMINQNISILQLAKPKLLIAMISYLNQREDRCKSDTCTKKGRCWTTKSNAWRSESNGSVSEINQQALLKAIVWKFSLTKHKKKDFCSQESFKS